MKSRAAFLCSIVFVLCALSFLFAARGQIERGFRAKLTSDANHSPQPHFKAGALFLYVSIVLALASAIATFLSKRKHEPAWRWVTIVLLALYLFIVFAPV